MFRKLKSDGKHSSLNNNKFRYAAYSSHRIQQITRRRDIAVSLKGTLGKNLLRKLTNDGKHSSLNNNKFRYAAYSSRYPAIKKETQRSLFLWQGRRDSNTQPTVLETATLPLSHSPTNVVYFTIKKILSQ